MQARRWWRWGDVGDLFCEWRYLKLSEKKNQDARYGVRARAEKKRGGGVGRGGENL